MSALGVAGKVVGGAFDAIPGGTAALNALNTATNDIAQAASFGVSALPGGTGTFTWDQAGKISPEQAMLAQVPQWEKQGPLGMTAAQLGAGPGYQLFKLADPNNPLFKPDFNVTDEAQRKAAFSDSPVGKIASGIGDATFDWYADAGVIGGKALKVARQGTQVGSKSFMGLTDRTIRTADDVAKIAQEVDEGVMYIKSAGAAGRRTALADSINRTVTKDAAEMLFDPLAKRSTNKGLVASLLGESTDLDTSAMIVKAGIGDKAAMEALRTKAASTADALERSKTLEESMKIAFNKPIGQLTADDWWVRSPEAADRITAIVDDLVAKDAFLSRALDLESNMGTISKVGSRSASLEAARGLYYSEKATDKLDSYARVVDNQAPQFIEQTFQRNPWVRPVRVIAKVGNFAEGVRPSGWIGIKGQLTNDSADEFLSALTDAPALRNNAMNAQYRRDSLNAYLSAATSTERMQVVTRLERDAAYSIADAYNIPKNVADQMYGEYSRARQTATQYLNERGYGVDLDGSIYKSPVLSSQLASSIPMMDFRVYEDLIRRHQNAFRNAVGASQDFLRTLVEPVLTAWKASVLFRLGYTIRNVAEGNARAAAGFGFIPALADPFGTARRYGANRVRNAKIAGNYVREILTNENPKFLNNQIRMLRDAQDAAENQLSQLRVQSRMIRQGERPAATGVDTLDLPEYLQQADVHGTRLDLGDLEQGIASPSRPLLPSRQRQQFFALRDRERSGEILTGQDVSTYRHLQAKAARTRLREIQATGKDVAVRRNGETHIVDNVRDLTDEDLLPIIEGRRATPGAAIESGDIPVSSSGVKVRATRPAPEVFVIDPWRKNMQIATRMGTTVPGRAAARANVRNPRPFNKYEYELGDSDSMIAASTLDNIRTIEEDLSRLYSKLDRVAASRASIGKRQRIGDNDAFDGEFGDIARLNSSADQTYENVIQDMMSRYEVHQSQMVPSWGPISPNAKNYFDELAHVANNQFRNDPVAMAVLRGDRIPKIANDLKSPDMRWYRDEMRLSNMDIDGHVGQIYDLVTSYLPDDALRLRLSADKVSSLDIQRALIPHDKAQIHGRQLSESLLGGVTPSKIYRGAITEMYRILGSAPEDLAVRHPFYRQMFISEENRLKNLTIKQDGVLDEKTMANITQAAHSFALKETKRTLYTIERYSDAAVYLRWVMPFFPAYENTIKTWLRLSLEDPSVIARASMIWDAPNVAGLVVDKDGNPLPAGATFDKAAYIRLPKTLADALEKHIPGGQIPDIPKQSVNFVLPGENPSLPGFGPAVTVPVNRFIADDPSRERAVKRTLARFFGKSGASVLYNQIVPFGTASGDMDVALSSSLKQAAIRVRGESDPDYMVSALGIYRDMLNKWYADGSVGLRPNPQDALSKADSYRDLRVVAAITQPFAMRWRSPYQQYIEEYRRLVQQNGLQEGERLFDQKYPEYHVLKDSLTSNPTGMESSMKAYSIYKENKSLWNDVTGIDPKYGQMITNSANPGKFTPTIYEWQKGRPVRPGSDVLMKTAQSLEDFGNAEQVSAGWSDFRKAKAIRDALLAQRGLDSVTQKGAEDIQQAWRAWLAQAEATNPLWFTEKTKYSNAAAVRETISAITKIAYDDAFMSSTPDKYKWILIKDYLNKRQIIVDMLQQRQANGGSATITANRNGDIADAWAAYVAKVRASNTDFADFYDRWLDSDDLQNVTVN
jgi:hypothetical protein